MQTLNSICVSGAVARCLHLDYECPRNHDLANISAADVLLKAWTIFVRVDKKNVERLVGAHECANEHAPVGD
jgi:hypothetical protein